MSADRLEMHCMHVAMLLAMLVAALFAGSGSNSVQLFTESQHCLQTLWKQHVCKVADVVQIHITNTALLIPSISVCFPTILVSWHIF